jgi:hypothetical protein
MIREVRAVQCAELATTWNVGMKMAGAHNLVVQPDPRNKEKHGKRER